MRRWRSYQADGQTTDGVRLAADGQELAGFAADADLGGLPASNAAGFVPSLLGEHRIAVVAGGTLAPASPVPGDVSAFDESKLEDLLLAVHFRIARAPVPLARVPLETAVVHYRRAAADYADWGLHLWGDAIGATVATTWRAPRQRRREDAYGAVFEIPLLDDSARLNFSVRRSGANANVRDAAGDRGFVPAEHPEVWIEGRTRARSRFGPPQ